MNGTTPRAPRVRKVGTTASGAATKGPRTLPGPLLDLVPGRVALASALYALVYVVALVASELTDRWVAREPFTWNAGHMVAAASVAIALVVSGLARSRRIGDRHKVRLGLAFEVLGSLGIALGALFGGYRGEEGISWICVWIAVYPLIVPSVPLEVLVASILSALTGPLALWLWSLVAEEAPSARAYVVLTVPHLICAGVAWFAARTLYTIGRELSRERQLGSYELVSVLGRGGMGEVWEGRHRMLARPAAIKLIRPDVLDQDDRSRVVRRFRREAEVTARLQSPHSVALYDFGVADDGTFFYVMEKLDGLDLHTLVTRFGPLPAERVVWIARQVCRSLAEAHGRGLIHHDVKPSNIIVGPYGGEEDVAKVLDFGLARAFDSQRASEDVALETASIEIVGTPAFMSPEVVMRKRGVGAASDLYALGCVLYWMLTGRFVFPRDGVMAMLMAHTSESPEAPSRHAPGPVPSALDAVVLRCLEKDPQRRPAGAVQLGGELADIAFPAPWTEERARAWWADAAARGLASPPSPARIEPETDSTALRGAADAPTADL